MRIIICLILGTLISYVFSDKIREYSNNLYIICACLSLLIIGHSILSFSGYRITYFVGVKQLVDAVVSGALGGSLFIIVMYLGALDMRLKPLRRLKIIRSELSILACIFTIPHNFHYFINFIVNNESMVSGKAFNVWTNLMMFSAAFFAIFIMLPLFVTSFKYFRRKMSGSRWKNLQEYAYIFYGLIFIQVIMVYIQRPSSLERNLNLVFYILIFSSYLGLKLERLINRRRLRSGI